ncbi:MAG: 16S rRNA (uracil(1498)-N(3))-methyltransferase, partial [Oscillospiraceae bacterium]|nr:16S rRNA (uracil(1498)-N(3))-methyltransferase [Oscillospiraceae bacterium]
MKIFVEQKNIQGELINISNDDWHHLTKVLRARAGDEVIACDGEFDYICQLSAVSCQLEVVSKKKCEAENKTHITIFQGVPKQAKMETIIAMCSELGVNRIVPFESEFCVASLPDDKKLTRWRKIALESAKQCGRDRVLDIAAGVSFD